MKLKLIIALVISMSVTGFVLGQEPDEGDIQIWNETKVYFLPISRTDSKGKEQKFIAPHFIGAIRIGQDGRHFVNERIGFGADITINKYLKITPSYLYLADQPTKNKKAFEHRIRFDATVKKDWEKAELSNRNRFERRIRNSRADSTRYRNKTKFAYDITDSDGKVIVTPFVADEPYYDFSKSEWSRNEFSVGFEKKFNSNLTGEFFYLLQTNTGSTLRRINAFGVNLKITLD